MKLHQFVSVDAVARHDMNLTRAAASLNASQPALSMHIQLLEAELRTPLFVRQRNRFVGLTPAGETLLPIIARAVAASDELKRTARQYQAPQPGTLTVAASQTFARYTLPTVVERFSRLHPKVQLRVRHGTLTQLLDLVMSGNADLAISTAPKYPIPELLSVPCSTLGWLLVASPGHALLRAEALTLKVVSDFPIITYDETFASHGALVSAFEAEGIVPRFALLEADSDIMKQYAKAGLGVAIIKDGAFNAELDAGLGSRKLDGLIPSTPIEVTVRRGAPLNKGAMAFMHMMQPKLATTLRRKLGAAYR